MMSTFCVNFTNDVNFTEKKLVEIPDVAFEIVFTEINKSCSKKLNLIILRLNKILQYDWLIELADRYLFYVVAAQFCILDFAAGINYAGFSPEINEFPSKMI